jgi:uncharacterized damage-inducible protein DinB
MENDIQLKEAFVQDIMRYLLEENFPRVIKCLNMLNEKQIWWRPNEQSNSVGNLILHLCGNLNQWVLNSIGNIAFKRQRQAEFDARETMTKSQLLDLLLNTKQEIHDCIKNITLEELLRTRPVQIYEEKGTTILIHVTEHFSYHTGQIAYITKWLINQQTNFYENL